jgi:Ser-tRNA(Ala) deacylase AlaX
MADQEKRPTEKREIHVGRDYFEKVSGTVTTGASIHGDHAQQQVNAQQYAAGITPQSSKEEVARLLALIQQELAQLNLPDEKKEEVATEIKAAELQVKKEKPDKPKIADRLKSAAAALKEVGMLGMEAVALGNTIGKAILWCGEQWTQWII